MEIIVHPRTIFGKKTNALRAQGFIPGEVFGHKQENSHISVPRKAFMKLYKEAGENTLITLAPENGKKIQVMVKDVAYNHMTGEILAIDFHAVRMDEVIEAHVPLEFVGEAPATKNGHVVIKVLTTLEVKALPDHIPHRFEVNLTVLQNPGDTIHLKDITVPKGVKITLPLETVLVTIIEHKKKEEVPVVVETTTPTESETTPTTTQE